jgi:hypothetical protein
MPAALSRNDWVPIWFPVALRDRFQVAGMLIRFPEEWVRLLLEEGFSTSLFLAGASRVCLPCPVVCRARFGRDDGRGAAGAGGQSIACS